MQLESFCNAVAIIEKQLGVVEIPEGENDFQFKLLS